MLGLIHATHVCNKYDKRRYLPEFLSVYFFSLWLSSCAFATDESSVFILVPTKETEPTVVGACVSKVRAPASLARLVQRPTFLYLEPKAQS